jgi:hypothetical protein
MLSSLALRIRALAARSCSLITLTSARSNPATWVPPLGGGDHVDERPHRGVVAGVQRSAMSTPQVALDLLGGHVPLVVEDRHGLGEVPVAGEPDDR